MAGLSSVSDLDERYNTKRRKRCGECAPCRVTVNCDECKNCINRKILKQTCIYRKCIVLRRKESAGDYDEMLGEVPYELPPPRAMPVHLPGSAHHQHQSEVPHHFLIQHRPIIVPEADPHAATRHSLQCEPLLLHDDFKPPRVTDAVLRPVSHQDWTELDMSDNPFCHMKMCGGSGSQTHLLASATDQPPTTIVNVSSAQIPGLFSFPVEESRLLST